MGKIKVIYGKISNYISQDTEELMRTPHPCILIRDESSKDNFKEYAFVFTHDSYYGIEKKQEKFACSFKGELSTTRIGDMETYYKTVDYYENIVKNEKNVDKIMDAKKWLRLLNNFGIECKCPHYTEKPSYLMQDIAVFKNFNERRFTPLAITPKQCVTKIDFEKYADNQKKFEKYLPIVKKALISNVLEWYEPSSKNEFTEISKYKFNLEERINLSFEIHNELCWQEHRPKIEKVEFIDRIIDANASRTDFVSRLKELKEKNIVEKIFKDDQLEKIYIKDKNDFKTELEKYNCKISDEKCSELYKEFCDKIEKDEIEKNIEEGE